MSETPERPENPENPQNHDAPPPDGADASATEQSQDASSPIAPEPPTGLPPAPGLQPPAGMQPPQSPTSQYHPPAAPARPDAQSGPAQSGPGAPQMPQGMQPPQGMQFPQQPQGSQQPQSGPPQMQPPQGHAAPQQPGQYGAPQQPGYAPQGQAPQGQAPQGYGQPGQPQYAGAPGSAPRKKGLSTGALIGIIGGAVGLVILIIIAVFVFGALSSGGGSQKTASSPEQAVEEYLTALSEGDADTARKLAGGSSSDVLLTDDVLKESLEIAPISNIEIDEEGISEGKYDETVVPASFDVGDQTVKRDFRLWQGSKGWELSDGLVRISLSQFKGLDPQVNGEKVGTDSESAFIGAYRIELGEKNFRLAGDTDTFVVASDDDTATFYELEPELTDEARQRFQEMVRASLNECLALKTLTTPCGMDVDGTFSGGEVAIDGTVVRTLTAEGDAALNALDIRSDYDNPTVVTSSDYISVTITVDAEKDGQRGSGEVLFGADMLNPAVDFSADEPKVVWQ